MPPQSADQRQPATPSRLAAWKTPTPFAGREQEKAVLLDAVDAAVGGEGVLVLIGGEPGVGKTRLAQEVMAEARGRGASAWNGRCYETGGAPPYAPFVEILESAARVSPPAALREILGDSAPEVAKLLPELRRLFPDIPPALELAPEQERHYLLNSVREFVARAARARPLLLLLDDLQWADDSTLLLLQHIAQQLAEMPVLILGAYRDVTLDPASPLARALESLTRQRLAERVALKPLPEEGVAAMLRGLSGQEPPALLLQALHSETEGNPFFVEEVYRHLAEEGKLFDTEGRWLPYLDIAELEVPEGVRLVIGRRLQRLSEECRATLTSAAVVGRDFSFELLDALNDVPSERLLEVVDEAARAHLIVSDADRPDAPFTFVHELIRQTLLGGLTVPRRQRLHRRVAEALERVHAANLEPHLAALAVHFRFAGPVTDVEKAIRYSIHAGNAAAGAFAYAEALAHLQAALDLMEDERGADPERRAYLLERLGDVLYLSGLDLMKGLEYLERALTLYEELGDPESGARVHCAIGRTFSTLPGLVEPARALAHYRAAELVFRLAGDERALADVYLGMASVANYAGRSREALEAAARAMVIGERLRDDVLWASGALGRGSMTAFNEGRLAEGLGLLKQAYERFDRLDHPGALLAATAWQPVFFFLMDPRETEALLMHELAKPRAAGSPGGTGILQIVLAQSRLMAGTLRPPAAPPGPLPPEPLLTPTHAAHAVWHGDWERAEAMWRSFVEAVRQRGNRAQATGNVPRVARLCWARGDRGQAAELLEEALTAYGEEPFVALEMLARPDLVLLYVEMGRLEEARAHLARCREIRAQGEDWRGVAGRLALAEAALAAADGDLEAAETHFQQALDIYRRYGLPWDQAEAFHVRGRAFAAAGRRYRSKALEAFDAAISIYRELGAGQPWIDRVETDRQRLLGAHPRVSYPAGLSQREAEVLRLIAAGRSSREIGEELVLSVRTVERHIANIYLKTGTHGRAQATAYAFANGLAPEVRTHR